MDVRAADAMARELMQQHGLTAWSLKWDNARRRFGVCRRSRKVISLSKPLVAANSESDVRDTILHEIAHALAPAGIGHGVQWKVIAARIGARPQRCAGAGVARVPGRWRATCACNTPHYFYKAPNARATYKCRGCRTVLAWEDTKTCKGEV